MRSHPTEAGELLILGGESHKTGQGGDTTECYARLEDWARERFNVESVQYRWSAQDCMPADGNPYIGPLTPRSERVFAASARSQRFATSMAIFTRCHRSARICTATSGSTEPSGRGTVRATARASISTVTCWKVQRYRIWKCAK